MYLSTPSGWKLISQWVVMQLMSATVDEGDG
jgi:hypothetical protein